MGISRIVFKEFPTKLGFVATRIGFRSTQSEKFFTKPQYFSTKLQYFFTKIQYFFVKNALGYFQILLNFTTDKVSAFYYRRRFCYYALSHATNPNFVVRFRLASSFFRPDFSHRALVPCPIPPLRKSEIFLLYPYPFHVDLYLS